MNKAVIDVENGGFQLHAGMVEIGFIVVDENLKELARYSSIIERYFQIDSELPMIYTDISIDIHGITAKDQAKHGKPPREVVKEIEDVFQMYKIQEFIGHNIKRFDYPKLTIFFDRFSTYDPKYRFPYLIDTIEIAKGTFNFDSYSLTNLCNEFDIEHFDKHRALGDCDATLKLLIEMNKEIDLS